MKTPMDIFYLYTARGVRGFGDGFAIIILPAYLSAIGFGPAEIGLIASASLLGTALLTLAVGLIAPRHDLRTLLLGGAVLMTYEYAPPEKRGLYASLPQIGLSIGLCLASGVVALLSYLLTNEQFLAWGWRVAFVLSFVLVLIGLYIRLNIKDFIESAERGHAALKNRDNLPNRNDRHENDDEIAVECDKIAK